MDATIGSTRVIDPAGLGALLRRLQGSGYTTIGPTVRDGAIVYDEIDTLDDLPAGWTDEQAPGHYRLQRRPDGALFGYNVGPHTWKRVLFPAHRRLWQLRINGRAFARTDDPKPTRRYAFVGVRACDLCAIGIQDRVFSSRTNRDEYYTRTRSAAFIVAVNCTRAGATCFCDSMGTGPRCHGGFDLALTELVDDGRHEFLVEIGSERGARLLHDVPARDASPAVIDEADRLCDAARSGMGHTLDTGHLRQLVRRNVDHPRWNEIAERCLACANCTLVCPTCFCSHIDDTSDLSGQVAERWLHWDSCFNTRFSYTHGGSVRASTASRYRQWFTHKFSTWFDQFGTSGCVGCGRCITWCPVGIDVTEEARVLRERDGEHLTSVLASGGHSP
jgi:sulfhydrogenase subunit beta (sulfur reductase)